MEKLNQVRVLDLHEGSYTQVRNLAVELGIPLKMISLGEVTFYQHMKTVTQGQNDFSSYLKVIKNCSVNFHYQLIELTSYIATQMVCAIGQESAIKKIVFAAMFCDMTLKRSEWLHIRTSEQFRGLSGAIIKEINMHALKAAELTHHFPWAPQGSAQLIKEHHADIHGLGLQLYSNQVLSPVTRCLIAAQELAYAILLNHGISPKAIATETAMRLQGTILEEVLERFEDQCHPQYAKAGSC